MGDRLRQVSGQLEPGPQGLKPGRDRPGGGSAGPPFDTAAHAWILGLRGFLPGKNALNGLLQILASDVGGVLPVVIHASPVVQATVRIEKEEVWCARGT